MITRDLKSFILLILFCVILCFLLSPKAVSTWVQVALKKECPQCTLNVKTLQVKWFPFRIIASDVRFKGNSHSNPMVHFSLGRVESQFQFFSLFGKAPTLEHLTLNQLHITVKEPDQPSLSVQTRSHFPEGYPPGFVFQSLPAGRVNRIRIHQSQLTYQHEVHGKIAQIDVQEIEGSIDSFVTRDWLLKKEYQHSLNVNATARLENSGLVKLDISFDPFANENHDKIVLQVEKQDMTTLNPFFEVEEGITFKGVLFKAVAELEMNEGQLSGSLTAYYHDLDVKFQATPDRGSFKSFLLNFAHSVTTSKTRPRKDEKSIPYTPVFAVRRGREPITQLMIRGLSESAKDLMTS